MQAYDLPRSASSSLTNVDLDNDQNVLQDQIDQLSLNDAQKINSSTHIKALSSLILDQLNTQDAHAILQAQKQAYKNLIY
jgi:hypothetical protein